MKCPLIDMSFFFGVCVCVGGGGVGEGGFDGFAGRGTEGGD